MNSDYQPISCALHSELELKIMHREKIEVTVRQDTEEEKMMILPCDLVSRQEQGEYLLGQDDSGREIEIRLDKLISFTAKDKA